MTAAVPCSHRPCTRRTKDASGRCHDHRGGSSRGPVSGGLPPAVPPAAESTYSSHTFAGGAVEEEWKDAAGLRHRTDGPAFVETARDGSLEVEVFYVHGDLHRRGGPAVRRYLSDGRVYAERWCVNGQTSRIDGPAEWLRDENGAIEGESFYFRGRGYGSVKAVAEALEELEEDDLTTEFSHSSLAPLLDEGYPASRLTGALAAGITTAEGARAYLDGAPAEWARAFEEARS